MRPIETRKHDHLRLCLTEDVSFPATATGFEGYRFMHQALPELDFADVDPTTTFLGKRLSAPLLISSMTGGPEKGADINRNLAKAAQRRNVALAVGSQRIGIEHPDRMATFSVREVAPDILLIGNLGAVQLNYGFGAEECRRIVGEIGADALYLHLNPLQEVVQPEGNTDFRGLLAKIGTLAGSLGIPVLVKEVGNGIAPNVAARLADAGVAAIDVSGAGGTSWSRIEGKRSDSPAHRELGEAFADWGIPTAIALRLCRPVVQVPLVASGGIRTGIEMAKAIALGADMVALALPFLEAATESADAAEAVIERLVTELKVAMFCIGARTLDDLKGTPHLWELG